jgi:hypothetical protein
LIAATRPIKRVISDKVHDANILRRLLAPQDAASQFLQQDRPSGSAILSNDFARL